MTAIAIDGPAGAGKSTLARELAKKLGYIYVDTGALYRALALKLLQNGISVSEETEIIKLLEGTAVTIDFKDGMQRVFLDGNDVTELIRTPEVSMAASRVSALPEVRNYLLELQRSIGKSNNILMDGRDIGTVVLPDAQVKIFLTASDEERAHRRHKELIEKGMEIPFDRVFAELKERDYSDSHRAVAPLRPADDAITVDTTGLDLNKSLELLFKTVTEKLKSL